MNKARLTVSVDHELVEAGAAAVAEGRAESVSAWVNQALEERAVKDRRLAALAEAVAAYEADHGAIGAEEIAARSRADHAAAEAVRRRQQPGRLARRRPKGAA